MRRFSCPALLFLAAAPLLAAANPEMQSMLNKFREFLHSHEAQIAPMERAANLAWWEASTTGDDAAYKRQSELQTKVETLYTDPKAFAFLKEVKASGVVTDPAEKRLLEVLYLRYLGRQLDPKLLAKIIEKSTAIEQRFSVFRARVNDKEVTDNQIDDILASSRNRAESKAYWLASKQVGAALATDVVEVVKLRNQAAKKLGFRDFYALQLALNEQDETWLLGMFDELDRLTVTPFALAKAHIDEVQAARVGVKPADVMPWDYSNRFFQEAPNLSDADFDAPLASKDIGQLVAGFYRGIGLDADAILANSDLYEHKGKNPHAFSTDIDHNGDVRALLNIQPNQNWLGTTLHELGHGVYEYYINRSLPYFLRTEDHIFATEGVAMMFGRLAENAAFYRAMGLVDDVTAAKLAAPMSERLRNEALLFSRWCQVMLRFERELYANPGQDLDQLWWRLVEHYQGLKRPVETPKGAWAAKIHLVSVPVYYHNYELGDLFASQLHAAICRALYPGTDPSRVVYVANPKVGAFMKERVFGSGASLRWPDFVQAATDEPLSPRAFAAQFVAGGAPPPQAIK
ncbi:MAG: M2 family metallopeptidase [Thermoanaerobaculales bacterium]